jgi:hypothetical protein
LLVVVTYWIGLLSMLRGATGCGRGRVVAAAVGLPVVWAVLAVVLAVGLPLAVAFAGLVVLSLRS